MPKDPIRITGIIIEEVGNPRNDGTPGSALYEVPFRLSREPSYEWAQVFERTWDWPPSWTSMHRSGICHVIGEKIILNGTTLEEVEKIHKETLEVVLRKTNALLADSED
jgi:hypothetical protein